MQLIRRYPLFQKLDLPLERVRVLALCTGSPSDSKQWGKITIGSTRVTYPLPYTTYSLPITVGLSPFYGSYYGNYYRPVLPANPDLVGTDLTSETTWEGFYIVVGQ